jgi:hypothetical protein
MARRFGQFFSDVWRSASDMRFYGEVAALPFWSAFRHLLKVVAALGVVLAVMLVVQLVFLNGVWRWCMDNLPVIAIRNGVASAEVPQPKVIERAVNAKESFAVIIDTTGATAGIDPKYTGGVLVKKKGIVIRVGETVFSRDYLDRASFTVDRAYFRRLIVRPPWIALIAAGIFPGVLAALFIQSAAAAALGTLVSRIRGAGCPFRAVLQMSFYAATLAVCFLFAVVLVGVRLSPLSLLALYAFVHVAFLVGAVFSAGGSARAA